MNRYRGIKYSFRPKSYWNDGNVLQVLLRDVKGAERRKMIKHYYEQGMFQELDETFTKSSLTEDERNRFGVIHPSLMGGEYLPDCNPSETEIARVTLRSTTAGCHQHSSHEGRRRASILHRRRIRRS